MSREKTIEIGMLEQPASPSTSDEAKIAPLQGSHERKELPSMRRCSRCGAEPRTGWSGWGRRCIRDKMREMRAGRQVVNCPGGTGDRAHPGVIGRATIEAALTRMRSLRVQPTP
jgi:hypothetical protein